MSLLAATPLLRQAHHELWQVREACHDVIMEERLAVALAAVQDAQQRLRMIEREAREAAA